MIQILLTSFHLYECLWQDRQWTYNLNLWRVLVMGILNHKKTGVWSMPIIRKLVSVAGTNAYLLWNLQYSIPNKRSVGLLEYEVVQRTCWPETGNKTRFRKLHNEQQNSFSSCISRPVIGVIRPRRISCSGKRARAGKGRILFHWSQHQRWNSSTYRQLQVRNKKYTRNYNREIGREGATWDI